jgi:hypothetical protein
LIKHRVEIVPETLELDRGRAGKCSDGGIGSHEPSRPKWQELGDRNPIPRHDEGLAAIESTHDLVASVP